MNNLTDFVKEILPNCPNCGRTGTEEFRICHAKITYESEGRFKKKKAVPSLEAVYACKCVRELGYQNRTYHISNQEIKAHFAMTEDPNDPNRARLDKLKTIFNPVQYP